VTDGHRFAFVLEQTLGHVAHTQNLSRALARRPDIDATLIKIPFEPPSRAQTLPGLRNWSLRASLAARAALHRRIAAGPLDAVFIHTQVASLLSVGVMHRVPTAVSLDATPINFDRVGAAYGHSRHNDVAESIKLVVNRRTMRSAAALVTWCAWASRSVVDDYGLDRERIHTIHPGVDLELFDVAAGREERSGPVRVLFVGGDFERKGGSDLLAALEAIGPSVEADIVTPRLPHGAASDRIRHHAGLKPQSAPLIDLYRRADIFALPARGDCFPQAIAEAMAAGLPVIATRVGAIDEMVADTVNGLLVRPGAPYELTTAINRLATDENMRRRMGAASRAHAMRNHDAMANAGRIFDLMASVAATGRRTVLSA